MGGYVGRDSYSRPDRSVETVDLRTDPACTLPQTNLPDENYFNFGIVDRDGNPMSCGGQVADPSSCLLFSKELDQWVEGPRMNYARNDGGTSVRLSDGRYFVIGTNITSE